MSIEVQKSDGTVDRYVDSDELDTAWEEDADKVYERASSVLGREMARDKSISHYTMERHTFRISDVGTLLILRDRYMGLGEVEGERRVTAGAESLVTSKAGFYEPAEWESVREVDDQ